MEENRKIKLMKQKLPSLSNSKKQEILQLIKDNANKHNRGKKLLYLPIISMCISLLIISIFLVPLFSKEHPKINKVTVDKGINNSAEHYLPLLSDVKKNQFLITIKNDDMDEWKYVLFDKELIVDPAQKEHIQRGDIVYFHTTKLMKSEQNVQPNKIARIVALPGETISVNKGQVFINGIKLDTFYGHERDRGENVVDSTTSLKPVKLLPNEYFVISDTWWRGIILKNGKIKDNDILGKVIGIKND